jgi:hypothetical protein
VAGAMLQLAGALPENLFEAIRIID